MQQGQERREEVTVLVDFADSWMGESAAWFSRKVLGPQYRHLQPLILAAKKEDALKVATNTNMATNCKTAS